VTNLQGIGNGVFALLSDEKIQLNSRFVEHQINNQNNTFLGTTCLHTCNDENHVLRRNTGCLTAERPSLQDADLMRNPAWKRSIVSNDPGDRVVSTELRALLMFTKSYMSACVTVIVEWKAKNTVQVGPEQQRLVVPHAGCVKGVAGIGFDR